MPLNRRAFLQQSGLAATAWPLRAFAAQTADQPAFTLPKLPYAEDALEPHLDAQTMAIHHGKHHQAYVTNLNKALEKVPAAKGKTIEALLRASEQLPADVRQTVINNGGGHANHTLFWESMAPKAGGTPGGPLGKALTAAFGSFAAFQEALATAAQTRFGSGWAWLVLDQGKLAVRSTGNQDSPLLTGAVPLLGLDVWEHAYYLKYQNRRDAYVKAWWNVVNWPAVAERHERALKS